MRSELLIGLGVAVVTGMLISVQATLVSRGGAAISDLRAGMLTAALGGAVAVVVLALLWRQGGEVQIERATWIGLFIAGAVGTLIMSAISFSTRSLGVSTALATLLLGQMVVAMIIDARGLAGGEAVPVTPVRVMGILLLFVGVYLTVGRQP